MTTPGAFVVVALPTQAREKLEASSAVAFVGGVTLDEEVDGARALKKRFLETAATQLTRPPAARAGAA
jgi:hypothetical protein